MPVPDMKERNATAQCLAELKNSQRYVRLGLLPVTTKWSLTGDGGDIHPRMNFSCKLPPIM